MRSFRTVLAAVFLTALAAGCAAVPMIYLPVAPPSPGIPGQAIKPIALYVSSLAVGAPIHINGEKTNWLAPTQVMLDEGDTVSIRGDKGGFWVAELDQENLEFLQEQVGSIRRVVAVVDNRFRPVGYRFRIAIEPAEFAAVIDRDELIRVVDVAACDPRTAGPDAARFPLCAADPFALKLPEQFLLWQLRVPGTGASDLSSLTEFVDLRELDVSYTAVRDLTPIADLTNLVRIDAAGSRIADIDAVRRLTKLRRLDVSHTAVWDLFAVESLTELTHLDLAGTKITAIDSVAALRELTYLNLAGTQVFDLAPLRPLWQLRELGLADSPATDLSPLTSLGHVRRLDLSRAAATDFAPLSRMRRLTSVDLTGTKITDLSPLSGLEALEDVNLSATSVSDLTPLRAVATLSRVRVPAGVPQAQIDALVAAVPGCEVVR